VSLVGCGKCRKSSRKGDEAQAIAYFSKVCKEISNEFKWTNNRKDSQITLGIPWIAEIILMIG